MMNNRLIVLALLLGACSGEPRLDPERSAALAGAAAESSTVTRVGAEAAPATAAIQQRPPGPAIRAAQENAARLAEDRERDAQRQSAYVLDFFGIQPGMAVLDLFSGGGYYAELVSYLVGPGGRVVAHNNSPYLEFAGKELAKRFTPGRLPNVERLLAENNELELPAEAFDAALMMLAYHDVYFDSPEEGWPLIDAPRMLAEIYRSLKPGGILGVVDHVAEQGAPAEVGVTLHRIDPVRLKREITAAGFVFDAESNVLRNPADDLTRSVFDPEVRGRTDRVVLRFRKPR